MSNRGCSALVLSVSLAVLPVAFGHAQATDPVIGTWELNVVKSKFGAAARKTDTRTYEAVGERVSMSAKGIDADGKPFQWQFEAAYDGKDYPMTGSPDWDTISLKRIDRFTVESMQKKAGKVVATNRRVISPDGKLMTITTESTNEKGVKSTNVAVFNKR